MSAHISQALTSPHSSDLGMFQDWRETYKAAILEEDQTMLKQRIADAEIVLQARAGMIFHDAALVRSDEHEAIERAMYFLRILANNPELVCSSAVQN